MARLIPDFISDAAAVLDWVLALNPNIQIVVVNVPHIGITPDIKHSYPTDPVKTERVTAVLRELNRQPGASYATFKKGIEHPDPAIAANVMIGLIKLTNYLLDRQLRQLEQNFLQEGGLRERMTRARVAARAQQQREAAHGCLNEPEAPEAGLA